ncbi:MAG: RDD family protein [Chloroflexota bacterium]
MLARTRARLLGYLVDELLLFVISTVITETLGRLGLPAGMGALALTSPDRPAALVLGTSITLLLSLAYYLTLWTGGRRTIGMRVFRMRVVDAAGSPVDRRQALRRWLILAGVFYLLNWVGLASGLDLFQILVLYAWFLVLLVSTWRNRDHQGVHDRVAHTFVISSRH